jgi:hypothetical protein
MADGHRGASLSGRGQWASTLRMPANFNGAAQHREKTPNYSRAPYKSAGFYAQVPARCEARASVAVCEAFRWTVIMRARMKTSSKRVGLAQVFCNRVYR